MIIQEARWTARLREAWRYKIIKGGRGSSKSWGVASHLVREAGTTKLRMLCTREFQKTIKDSVHKLLKDTIERQGLESQFIITDNSVRCVNGSEFIFAGLHSNIAQIKSLEGIDRCWVEEAETVSEESWRTLIPTIRKANSEILITFNPRDETDPTALRFIKNPPPNSLCLDVNWKDNPFFPDVLAKEMEYDYRVDTDAADWIWGGNFRKHSDAQIFKGKYRVESFEVTDAKGRWGPEWDGPWFGADWGFSQDPTVGIKLWAKGNTLYVEHEAWQIGCELNDIAQLFYRSLPGLARNVIRADNSRPETISHIAGFGVNCVAAKKWPGSVEDGIAWLRGLESIVIHPRCEHTALEAKLYSYKKDRVTQDILSTPLDKHNHCWDAIRYALEPAISSPERELRYEYDAVREEQVSISPELDQADYGPIGQGW